MPTASRKVSARVSTGRRIEMCLTSVEFHRNRRMKVKMMTNSKKMVSWYKRSLVFREEMMPSIFNIRKE